MKTKLLLDTNLLIYGLDAGSIFHKKTVAILTDPNLELYTTTKNIAEYFAVCSKLIVNSDIVFQYYNDISDNVTILFPNEHSLAHFTHLIKKYAPKGNRVYDTEITSIMLAYGITTLATFNVDDFKKMTEIDLFML